MKAGIVICAWNCIADVKRATLSAYETGKNSNKEFEILVHDDCSEIEPVESAFTEWDIPGTCYYKQEERRGLTYAWNTGIKWALDNNCDSVALCNQDIEFVDGWLDRFAKNIEYCEALSPLTNSPGIHSDRNTLQGQDIRKFIPGLIGKEIEPTQNNFSWIMDRIKSNTPVQADGIKGFFLGFRTDWLNKNRIKDGEYYCVDHAGANKGVGGSENEIFKRTGIKPWIGANMYIHHYREYGSAMGEARKIYLRHARL